MISAKAKILIGAAIALAAVVALPATTAVAGSISAGGAVRPQQTFVGLVNGASSGAKVVVDCSEAVRPGETGPPASGQTIAVRSPSPSTVPTGDTGTLGRKIVARIPTTSSAAASSVVFTHYGATALPTTWRLPCIGSGTIVFSPSPTSSTARSETMTVTFITPCPGVCASHRRRP
jgi:hypothetical protein